MSKISVLGSGRVGSVLALKLARAGHDITIGVRNPTDPRPGWAAPSMTLTDHPAAARSGEIVINATPGETALGRLSALRPELSGKILIDVSNAVERGENGLPGILTYPGGSLAEHLQEALPDTRVVKTLNTMLFTVMTDPASLTTPATVFLSGNHEDAKVAVRGLLGDLGWAPDRILDLGDIRTARGTEALILLVPDLLRARGYGPFAITTVT